MTYGVDLLVTMLCIALPDSPEKKKIAAGCK